MRFVLSSSSPPSLLSMLAGHGSRFELVDKSLGFLAVIERALALADAESDWTLLYQHRNAVNVRFHQDTTGAEILGQLSGRLPHAWVASIGTGGTLIGVSRALRASCPDLRTVGATPYDDSAVAHLACHRKCAVKPGQSIAASQFSGTGISTHIIAGATPDEVMALLRAAERGVRIEVREPHPAGARQS